MRKISDLSNEEMNDLVNDYLSPTEISVKGIVEKYDLDPELTHKMAKNLPPHEVEDLCPYCNVNMVVDIRNRQEVSNPYCLKCGHTKYIHRMWGYEQTCNCENCRKIIEEERSRKKEIIMNYYKDKFEPIDIDDMSLKDKFNFLKVIKGIKDYKDVNPKNKYEIDMMSKLCEKNILCVSPNSEIEAFSEKDFPTIYSKDKITYYVNVNLQGLEEKDAEAYIKREYSKTSPEEKYELFVYIMHKDILEKYKDLMSERNLYLEVSSNGEDLLKTLYDKLSYGQICNLCFIEAKYFSDCVITGKISKFVAARSALKAVAKLYDTSIKNGYSLNNSEVAFAGEELQFFITELMGKDIRALREVITIEEFI